MAFEFLCDADFSPEEINELDRTAAVLGLTREELIRSAVHNECVKCFDEQFSKESN